jgi:polysaccharide deacetylase family protein (PEP-CTERM system associated)
MKILTFDIEDWFHILDNPETKGVTQWAKFESRLSRNMDIIFRLLEDSQTSATFFVVGWIAEKHPDQIKRIVNAGFEVGSHTHLHQLVYEQNPVDFEIDLKRSVETLEQITGSKVKSFRAPGFSITESTPWAFESLLKYGIEFDSSVFPANRGHGGFPSFGTAQPSIIELNGMRLKEFPINTHTILGKEIIYSGGGYFRIFPYQQIKRFTKKSNYIMTYFHPRDFDSEQPIAPGLNMIRRFKSYYGLSKTESKLSNWLKDFEFCDLKTADESINWSEVNMLTLNAKQL